MGLSRDLFGFDLTGDGNGYLPDVSRYLSDELDYLSRSDPRPTRLITNLNDYLYRDRRKEAQERSSRAVIARGMTTHGVAARLRSEGRSEDYIAGYVEGRR